MNKVMLCVVTVMAVIFFFFPQTMALVLPSGDDEITPDMTTAVLYVEGVS